MRYPGMTKSGTQWVHKTVSTHFLLPSAPNPFFFSKDRLHQKHLRNLLNMEVAMSPALESPGRRPRKPPAEQVSGRFFYIYQSLGTTGLGQLRLQKKILLLRQFYSCQKNKSQKWALSRNFVSLTHLFQKVCDYSVANQRMQTLLLL